MNTLTLSVADFLAKTLVPLEKELVSQENALDYGSSFIDSSPRSVRATRSSKTLQPFDLVDWMKYSGASLRSGMTQSGTAFPLQPVAQLTRGTGSGLWPTPNCMDVLPLRSREALIRQFSTARKGRTKPANLREAVHPACWPQNLSDSSMYEEAQQAGHLNPEWVEWLMGFPEGWTDLSSSETQSSPKFLN